jgi:UDP-2,3-diacylglucosamine pyrophosphatase LpxH
MGHRHQVCSERIDQGLYVNLGHWLGADPTFGVFQPETAEMIVVSVGEFLGRAADPCPVR